MHELLLLFLVWLLFMLWVAGLYFTLCKDTEHCATLLNWPKELFRYYREQAEARTSKA